MRTRIASPERTVRRLSGPLVAGLVVLGACSPTSFASRADREVERLLAAKTGAALGDRADWVEQPREVEPEVAAAVDDPTTIGRVGAAQQILDLDASLAIAVDSAREYLTRRESLYLQGLSLSGVRFDFGPQLDATVSHVWNKVESNTVSGGATTSTTSASAGVSQLLGSGGTLSASGLWSTTPNGAGDGQRSDTTSADFRLSQPLLRGAGYRVSHEPITQAERDLLYEVRDFELFRQDFSIGIARDYFDLVSRRTRLSNEEQNYANAVFDRDKAEAFRQVDRNRDEDLFLARRRAIDAENRLLEAQTDYQLAVDTFRIRLGLPPSTALVIEEVEPPFAPVRLDPDSAVEVAIHNRLDLISARDRVTDSERRVEISVNDLLPDVDLDLGYGRRNLDSTVAGLTTYDASAGLSIEIPLQRLREGNSYRSALISVDRQRRDYELQLENTERDVRDRLRTLQRTEQQIDLQLGNIAQEERAVAVTEIRYESGDAESRDLLDARQALINAQNALIDLKVEHYISRLRLLRELGLLFIDNVGGMSS